MHKFATRKTPFCFPLFLVLFLCLIGYASKSYTNNFLFVPTNPTAINTRNIDTALVNQLNRVAFTHFPGKIDSVKFYAEAALEHALQLDYQRGRAEALRLLGIVNYYRSDFEEALQYYQNSLTIFELLKDKEGISKNYNNIAIIYDVQARREEALDYYLRSLEINRDIGFDKGIAYNLLNIGIIYQGLGRTAQALDSYMEALKSNQKRGDLVGVSLCLNNIATLYTDIGEAEQSIEYNRKALNIRKEIDDLFGMASSYNNIAMGHKTLNHTDSAKIYFDKAMDVALEVGDERTQAGVLTGLAEMYMQTDQMNKGIENLDAAYAIYTRINETEKIAHLLSRYGKAELKRKNLEAAREYISEGMSLAAQMNNIRLKRNLTQLMAQYYEKSGDNKNALEYYKRFIVLNDSIDNERMRDRSLKLDAEYEFMKKENQMLLKQQEQEMISKNKMKRMLTLIVFALFIVLILVVLLYVISSSREKLKKTLEELKSKNIEIASQKDVLAQQASELEKSDQVRNQLFSIIGHDLRGPLSYASNALESAMGRDQEYVTKILPVIKNNIGGIHEMMENLLQWASIKMKKESMKTAPVDIYKATSKVMIVLSGQASKKNIEIQNRITKNLLVEADQEMVEIVIRNLLTNAIKFSYQDSQIVVSSEIKDHFAVVCVRDWGTGMVEKDLHRILNGDNFHQEGTSGEKGTGLGLSLVRELLHNFHGKLWAESSQGEGSRFYFSLPASKS
ncbi:MAG: tetratricopeptide repeat protein [Bacteroidota bacterium]